MKGKGARLERETIINFNEVDETASIWTASEVVYRKLVKRGYTPREDEERHAVFEMPKRDIKLPRPKRQMTDAQRERAAANAKHAFFGKKASGLRVDQGSAQS